MATPHTSALAALMLQKNLTLTPDEVYNILRDTARDMRLQVTDRVTSYGLIADIYPIADPDPAGFDYDTGWGFVNGEAALKAVPVPQTSATRSVGRPSRR